MKGSGQAAALAPASRTADRGLPPHDPEREPQVALDVGAASDATSTQSEPQNAASSRSGYTRAGTVNAETLRQAEQAWADRQQTVSSCAFCEWEHQGTAEEGRDAARAHRQEEHPEACIRKPRLRRRMKKRSLRSADEEEQVAIDTAESRRLRSEREMADMLAKVERGRARDLAATSALDVIPADV